MRDRLLNNFKKIASIPRQSGHEEKIADFFVEVAKKNHLEYLKDKRNNVYIKKKGTKSSNPVVLQAHLDMVCVKTKDSQHDFMHDGIEVIVNGDEVSAKDTSLGADQGAGLAIILTILEEQNLKHPDLEFMLTVEEETTFRGVETFPYEKLKSRQVINLDSARDDAVVIGADGDIFSEYLYHGTIIENKLPGYTVTMDGFPGGNSGENIALSENNAITTMARLLKGKDIYLKSIDGGTFENDLATFCQVSLHTSIPIETLFQNVNVKYEKIDSQSSFTKEDTENILNEIVNLKCGALLKYASANLGMMKTNENEVKIDHMIRSIDESELQTLQQYYQNLNYQFVAKEKYRDEIWPVHIDSHLVKTYKQVYYEKYHVYPKEDICHCGIECTSIKRRIENLDMISIGCNILKYHTVEEKTYISSWIKIYQLVVKLLEEI